MSVTTEELFYLERQMHRSHCSCHQKAIGRLGLHYGQPLMLMILSEEQPLYQKELACRMNVSPASVTVSVKRMEKNGWITKVTNPVDMRYTAIGLTPKGEELAHVCREDMERVNEKKYVGFTPEEREQLADFYRRMSDNLKQTEQWEKGESK